MVQRSEEIGLTKLIQQIIHQWKRITIMLCDCIEFTKIGAKAKGAVILSNQMWLGHPFAAGWQNYAFNEHFLDNGVDKCMISGRPSSSRNADRRGICCPDIMHYSCGN